MTTTLRTRPPATPQSGGGGGNGGKIAAMIVIGVLFCCYEVGWAFTSSWGENRAGRIRLECHERIARAVRFGCREKIARAARLEAVQLSAGRVQGIPPERAAQLNRPVGAFLTGAIESGGGPEAQ